MSTYFPKEYLFTGKKRLPRVFISWEITAVEKVFPCKKVLGSSFSREYFTATLEKSGDSGNEWY